MANLNSFVGRKDVVLFSPACASYDEFDNYITPNSVYVTLLAAPSVESLLKVPGVGRVEDLGGNNFRLMSSDVNELVERMVEYSYEKGWRLHEIRVEKSSLNAVFAELSKKVK